jgi:hypothetical protein
MSRTIQCYTALCNSFQLHLYLYNNKMSAIAIKCRQFSLTVNDNGLKSNDQHYHILCGGKLQKTGNHNEFI